MNSLLWPLDPGHQLTYSCQLTYHPSRQPTANHRNLVTEYIILKTWPWSSAVWRSPDYLLSTSATSGQLSESGYWILHFVHLTLVIADWWQPAAANRRNQVTECITLTTWPWSPAVWRPPADLPSPSATPNQPSESGFWICYFDHLTLVIRLGNLRPTVGIRLLDTLLWPLDFGHQLSDSRQLSAAATRGQPLESGYWIHYFDCLTLVISWLMVARWPTIRLGNLRSTVGIRFLNMLLWPIDLGHQLTDDRQLTYHPPRQTVANLRNQVTEYITLTTWPWSSAVWQPPADLPYALATCGQSSELRSEYVTLTTWPWSSADWWPPADLLPTLPTSGQPSESRSEYVTLTTWPSSSADWWLPTDLPSASATRGKPLESGHSTHYFNRLTLVISWLTAASWFTIRLGNLWSTVRIKVWICYCDRYCYKT